MADIVYDEETFEVFSKRKNKYVPYPGGIGKMCFDRLNQLVSENVASVAQIDAATGKTQTFKEMLDASTKLAQYMRSIGIQPGDNITMCSYNHINATVVAIAAYFVGAVLSSTDPLLSLKDTEHLLNLVKPKLVFVSDDSEDLVRKCLEAKQMSSKVISVTLPEHAEFETIDKILSDTKIDSSFEPFFAQDLNIACSMLFSSGTTGLPKAICLSHNFFLSPVTMNPPSTLGWVCLNYASLYWISSVVMLGAIVWSGSTRLLCRTFDKETHWQLIAKYKVAHLILSNTYFMEAAKYLDESVELPHLFMIMVGGGLVPEEDIHYYTEKLPRTEVGYSYAMTESGMISHCKRTDKIASNGKPYANDLTIKIVDPATGKNLPLNKVGEIRVKQQYQMLGYYQMDSTDAWDEQGFLKTGDLGYLDDDFNVFIVDRIKEMFKYRSWHVVPAKIESVLYKHPDVLYAIIVGKPSHNEDDNHAMGIVCLREGATASAAELEEFANQQMDEINKIRAGVKIVDKSEIQFTPTGKINRNALKNKYIHLKM